MNNQKKNEDENRELQKRRESTRVKVQKLEMREPLLGKKSSESSACLVVALVHSLNRLDCDFILYGTGMLMVVVKLFNATLPEKKRELVVSTVNFMLQEKRKDLGGPTNCVILCRLVIHEAVENSATSRVG